MANAAYEKQKRNQGATEIVKMSHRGHSLTIDAGWREVAEKINNDLLAFFKATAQAAA